MTRFEIRDIFILDGKSFKILSGAIHYFRVPPEDWYHSLYNLKALGFNTVETYVAWNLHEPREGEFHFEGALDLERFLQTAQDLGLYAIVRPSPFICAEWEFGGLPAWLLTKNMRLRSSDPAYIEAVGRYYDQLLSRLVPHLLDKGGNILMMQVENEYGSYGEDKAYLRAIRQLMEERGVTCPLFTSDGPWRATLKAGTLIEDDLFVTGNFGSKAPYNFSQMQEFFDEHGKKWPLMCMEFWDGWFNRWKEPIITRDPKELADAVREVLEQGSINLYMFHGGTNFGFMNGCSARGTLDLPQVTSYDYDALLDEEGNPTAKYLAVKKMMATHFPEYPQLEPLYKESMELDAIPLVEKVSLFETLDSLSSPVEASILKRWRSWDKVMATYSIEQKQTGMQKKKDFVSLMVEIGPSFMSMVSGLKPISDRDWGKIFFYQGEKKALSRLDILVENMGRVNYGHKFLADTQRKGIRTGVCKDLHFLLNWKHYPLPLDNPEKIDFQEDGQKDNQPFTLMTLQSKSQKILTWICLSLVRELPLSMGRT